MEADIPTELLEGVEKRPEIEAVLRPLVLTEKDVVHLREVFLDEMGKGLRGDLSSLQMENTFVHDLGIGIDDGEFLSLDLGGTNFRVLLIHVSNGKLVNETVQYYSVPENVRTGKGTELFDFIASRIRQFLVDQEKLEQKFLLGFCFSFPMVQSALDSGVLVTWTKSFNVPDVVGQDAAALLRDAIRRQEGLQVEIIAILNDTTGTIVKGAYEDPRCALGFILATGCNGCYVERVDRIPKFTKHRPDLTEVVIDIEWGAFGDNGAIDFLKTSYDRQVDAISLLPTSFTFEKLFSGKFLGELIRHIILDLASRGLILGGKISERLSQPNAIETYLASELDKGMATPDRVAQLFSEMGYNNFSAEDVNILKYVCRVATLRGALLLATCLSLLLNRMARDYVTMAVDGSMFQHHHTFTTYLNKYVERYTDPKYKFGFLHVTDGSGKGAAILAAMEAKLIRLHKP